MATETISVNADIIGEESKNLREEIRSLINNKIYDITVDFQNAEAIDSIGIGILIAARNSLKDMNKVLTLINLPDSIIELFQTLQLDSHFKISGR